MITRTPRTLLAAALVASLLFVGCSDDNGDDDAKTDDTATAAVNEEYAELCTVARRGLNASTSEQLASAEAQLAAAPEDLKEDFEAIVGAVRYRTENPDDAAGIAARNNEVLPSLDRVVKAIERECGFNPLGF